MNFENSITSQPHFNGIMISLLFNHIESEKKVAFFASSLAMGLDRMFTFFFLALGRNICVACEKLRENGLKIIHLKCDRLCLAYSCIPHIILCMLVYVSVQFSILFSFLINFN